jgi:hypothetical protein
MTLVEGIKQEVRNEFDNKKDILAAKEDTLSLKIDIGRGFGYSRRTIGDSKFISPFLKHKRA